MRQLKIGTSSVRGVIGDPLTPEMIVDFACAFGAYCDGGAVVIGRDTRKSSTMLRAAVMSSLISAGCQVIDLGICPTPLVSFAVRELRADGGISITGSHNDIRWNALKFISADGALLNAVASEEVLDIYHSREFTRVSWEGLRRCEPAVGMQERYVQHLLSTIDVERIRAQRFRIVVDFCNGTAAPVVARLCEQLGCTLYPLNEETSNDFAHPPAPSVKNMRQLASVLRYVEADMGVAINIDGDRIGFVTSAGEALSEEYSFPLVADYLLSHNPGPVVTNLSTSRMIEDIAYSYGQPTIRTMIGEGHVIDKALNERAMVAGEGSGGIAILPTSYTFDAVHTMAVMLEAMAQTGESLHALADRMPHYHIRKGTLACQPGVVYQVLDGFRDLFPLDKTDYTEGVRVEWDDAWLHLRASNTEPLLRVIVEAKDAARADALFEEVMAHAHQTAFAHG